MANSKTDRFCFCWTVRQGLLLWGYAKLVYSHCITLSCAYLSLRLLRHASVSVDNAVTFLQIVTTSIPELLDLIFTIIFIIAMHKRNLKMLETYYYYSITMAALYTLLVLLTTCYMERFEILHDMIFHHSWIVQLNLYTVVGFGLGNICQQTYLMLLVGSEVMRQREAKRAKLARQKSSTSFRGLRATMVGANCRPNKV